MSSFATVEDMIALYRPLETDEITRAEALLPVISDRLRQAAINVGRNLDDMIANGELLENTVKSVTVDIVARCLQTPTSGAPMSQYAEAAGGYSVSGTFLSPGGGVFIKNSELKALGLTRQRIGVLEFYRTGDHHDD